MVGLKQPVQGLAEGDQAEDLLDQVEAVGPTALFHKDITVEQAKFDGLLTN